MPDDKRKRGRQDRDRIARLQPYEIYYVAFKFNVTPDKVKAVIRRVGDSRRAVYGALQLTKET